MLYKARDVGVSDPNILPGNDNFLQDLGDSIMTKTVDTLLGSSTGLSEPLVLKRISTGRRLGDGYEVHSGAFDPRQCLY